MCVWWRSSWAAGARPGRVGWCSAPCSSPWPSRCRSRCWRSSRRRGSPAPSPGTRPSRRPRSAQPPFTVPFAALAFTSMGSTRGLKIMRYTLYSQWIVQPIGWVLLTLAFWAIASPTAGWASAAFGVSWAAALLVAVYGWEKEQRRFPPDVSGDGIPEERTGALLRFGALRAPATLFSQLIFWTDLFVVSILMSAEPGRRLPGRRLQRGAAGGTGAVPVPHERLADVQPIRRRPASSRRAAEARRALQAGHPLDAGGDHPGPAGARR